MRPRNTLLLTTHVVCGLLECLFDSPGCSFGAPPTLKPSTACRFCGFAWTELAFDVCSASDRCFQAMRHLTILRLDSRRLFDHLFVWSWSWKRTVSYFVGFCCRFLCVQVALASARMHFSRTNSHWLSWRLHMFEVSLGVRADRLLSQYCILFDQLRLQESIKMSLSLFP